MGTYGDISRLAARRRKERRHAVGGPRLAARGHDHRCRPDLAIFAATSGHSGVDRIIANLVPELERAGLAVDLLQVRGHGPNPADLPSRVRRIDLGTRHVATSLLPLYRYLRRYRPTVLLSDKDRANRMAIRARRLAGVPTRIAVRLGTTVSVNLEAKGRVEAWLQRRSLQHYDRADVIIVPSRGAADDLARVSGLARQRIHVLPNPVITDTLYSRPPEHPPHPWLEDSRIPVILGVGSLTPRKDYATLLRAFALVRGRRACRLIVLGEGKETCRLREIAGELGVGADVALPGFVSDPYGWMQRAAVFAHTSRWEGLGIVLVEALALGLPVVAMDCPSGPSEVLDGGRHGSLVPLGDIEGFADAIERALVDPGDPSARRERARAFRTDVAADAYIDTLGLSPKRSYHESTT